MRRSHFVHLIGSPIPVVTYLRRALIPLFSTNRYYDQARIYAVVTPPAPHPLQVNSLSHAPPLTSIRRQYRGRRFEDTSSIRSRSRRTSPIRRGHDPRAHGRRPSAPLAAPETSSSYDVSLRMRLVRIPVHSGRHRLLAPRHGEGVLQ